MKNSIMTSCSRVLMVTMLSLTLWTPNAQAGLVTSDQLIASQHNEAARDRLRTLLDRQDVREQLQARGVDAAVARARVDALTDDEVETIAANTLAAWVRGCSYSSLRSSPLSHPSARMPQYERRTRLFRRHYARPPYAKLHDSPRRSAPETWPGQVRSPARYGAPARLTGGRRSGCCSRPGRHLPRCAQLTQPWWLLPGSWLFRSASRRPCCRCRL